MWVGGNLGKCDLEPVDREEQVKERLELQQGYCGRPDHTASCKPLLG